MGYNQFRITRYQNLLISERQVKTDRIGNFMLTFAFWSTKGQVLGNWRKDIGLVGFCNIPLHLFLNRPRVGRKVGGWTPRRTCEGLEGQRHL